MGTSVKSKNSELIAKRWAKALIELSNEDAGISQDDILDDLREISENIQASEELRDVLENPSVSTEEKQIVLCKLFQNKVLPIVYNFLFALNLKRRVNLIALITEEFEKELEVQKNLVKINVTSAIELNDERKTDIKNRISEKLSKDIIVNWGVDEDIIAGLIFNINETIVDNSIRHKLEKISKNIVKN